MFRRLKRTIEIWRQPADRVEQEMEELEFYHSLTVSRDEGVTAIDGGKTAEKLHDLWKDRERMDEIASRLGPSFHGHGGFLAFLPEKRIPFEDGDTLRDALDRLLGEEER